MSPPGLDGARRTGSHRQHEHRFLANSMLSDKEIRDLIDASALPNAPAVWEFARALCDACERLAWERADAEARDMDR
jgi:hypothetical protein